METSAATGAATVIGITSARSGTAISASPKPKVERTNVARNRIAATSIVVALIACGDSGKCGEIGDVGETRVMFVAFRQDGLGNWPGDAEIGIVPCDPDFTRCVVHVRAFVFDL